MLCKEKLKIMILWWYFDDTFCKVIRKVSLSYTAINQVHTLYSQPKNETLRLFLTKKTFFARKRQVREWGINFTSFLRTGISLLPSDSYRSDAEWCDRCYPATASSWCHPSSAPFLRMPKDTAHHILDEPYRPEGGFCQSSEPPAPASANTCRQPSGKAQKSLGFHQHGWKHQA